ncbi:uncharacterized protein LOC135926689 [Gordionus sp. m RMFG-2023]|uniref:uncharacterized protein LOC135926689 n=1 Tax=Gordionus sp. m RMFG-2023 TaxID=3053472 RepID=UPI0031FDF606
MMGKHFRWVVNNLKMLSFDNRFLPSLTAFLYITCLFTFKKSNSYYFKRSGLVKNDEDDGISKRHIPSESEECQYGLKPMTEDEWLFYMSGLIARVKNALMEAEMTLHDVEKDITVPDFVDTIHIYELDDVFRFTEDPPKKEYMGRLELVKLFL